MGETLILLQSIPIAKVLEIDGNVLVWWIITLQEVGMMVVDPISDFLDFYGDMVLIVSL